MAFWFDSSVQSRYGSFLYGNSPIVFLPASGYRLKVFTMLSITSLAT
jgi:hypothetical protein